MQLQSIITLASKPVEILFRAMERSLRATGCDLPLRVIPFSDDRFDLPKNSEWWEIPDFLTWIDRFGRRPVMRKYQALLASKFQFVDTDVIFLRNPAEVLRPHSGFITSCTHWHNPDQTVTSESCEILKGRTTTWQKQIFNTGQFASEEGIYSLEILKEVAENSKYKNVILKDAFHEQPGINLLVALTGIPITNLTLPPHHMESTWAGDYLDENYTRYWKDELRKPYLIHWAGSKMREELPIADLFFQHLSSEEKAQFLRQTNHSPVQIPFLTKLTRGVRTFCRELKA